MGFSSKQSSAQATTSATPTIHPFVRNADGKTTGKTMDKLRFQRIERPEPLQYLAHSKRRRRKQKGG